MVNTESKNNYFTKIILISTTAQTFVVPFVRTNLPLKIFFNEKIYIFFLFKSNFLVIFLSESVVWNSTYVYTVFA
jgi:hypothetical protein